MKQLLMILRNWKITLKKWTVHLKKKKKKGLLTDLLCEHEQELMFARRCRSEKFEDCDLFWSFAELHNTKCISLDYRQHTGGKYCLPPTGLQKPLLLKWNYCLTYIKKIHIYKFVSNAKKEEGKILKNSLI